MRIATRLTFASTIPLIVALIALAGFIYSYLSVRQLQEQQSHIISLSTNLNDVNDLARSYVVNHDDRSRRQLYSVLDEASANAERASENDRINGELSEIQQDLAVTRSLFDRIVTIDASASGAPTQLTEEAQERLASQVFIRNRDTNGSAARLVRSISNEIIVRQQVSSISISLITGAAAILLTAALLRLRRTILRSLDVLETGTRRVGSGDLEAVIGMTSADELGQLGRSFDKMTIQLRDLTVSRDELEAEVSERRKAEERLALALEAQMRETVHAEALNEVNRKVHASLDIDEIMGGVLEEIASALGADAVAVQVRSESSWEYRYAHGLPEVVRENRLSDGEVPFSMQVLRTRTPVMVKDVSRERSSTTDHVGPGIHGFMAVPLTVRGTVLGVLSAERFRDAQPFDEMQLDFFVKCAATIDLALENARLYETEHIIADRLQNALLALPERIGGLDFETAYRSASDAARVGGDFYDIYELQDGVVGIAIGDVAGKGLDAAVLTSLVKNTLRAHASELTREPSEILALTNKIVYDSTAPEMFVTVFFGTIDTRNGRIVYSNAGHTTAAKAAERTVVGLPPTGPILGAFPLAEFGQAEATLQPDEVLVLFTDGVIEARREHELYGEQRLHRLLGTVSPLTPSSAIHTIVTDVTAYSYGELHDDVALMAVKRSPSDVIG